MSYIRFILGFLASVLAYGSMASAAPIVLENRTDTSIINMCVQPVGKSSADTFFFRLDLLPGASDEVDNPDVKANLRADTGLEFWSFDDVALGNAKKIVFCADHPVRMDIQQADGKVVHVSGKSTGLVPQAGDRPVCNLEQFHPRMTMQEVCAILPPNMPQDDNGALMTGLGFGGLVWAARLIPTQAKAVPVSGDTLLEHLELRRHLSEKDIEYLLNNLFRQGYVPWQAEFPGQNLEFGDGAITENKKNIINEAIGKFLKAHRQAGHARHGIGEKCQEASILLAPAGMLPALENADEPSRDVQLFTIILRPCADTLLLDVAAYQGQPG